MGIKSTKSLKGSKIQKRLLASLGGRSEFVGSDELENGGNITGNESNTSVRLGHMVPKQDCDNTERDDCTDQGQSDGDAGLVRERAGPSLEAHISHNPIQHQNWESGTGPSGLESHTQPMVEIPHGCSSGFDGGIGGAEQVVAAISCAPLGRIELDHPRKETGGLQRSSHNAHGKPPFSETHSNPCASAKIRCTPLLQGGHSRHPEIYDDMETGLDGVQRYSEEDGMEYGGSSCNEY